MWQRKGKRKGTKHKERDRNEHSNAGEKKTVCFGLNSNESAGEHGHRDKARGHGKRKEN